jgi:hypothetical protein
MSEESASAAGGRHRVSNWAIAVMCVAIAALSRQSGAADALNPYIGAALGQSTISADLSFADALSNRERQPFDARHAAFGVMLGARPISWLGGELAYIDLGDAHGRMFDYPAAASIKGAAAFAVLYLPLPAVDLYVKAGAARLQNHLETIVPYLPICSSCTPPRIERDRSTTSGAAGAGSQFKFGAWAARVEYQRFNAAGGNSGLLSVGAAWSF